MQPDAASVAAFFESPIKYVCHKHGDVTYDRLNFVLDAEWESDDAPRP